MPLESHTAICFRLLDHVIEMMAMSISVAVIVDKTLFRP